MKEKIQIEVVEKEEGNRDRIEVIITETRIDGAGKEYEYSYIESLNIEELDRQIENHQIEIDKLLAKKDVIIEK